MLLSKRREPFRIASLFDNFHNRAAAKLKAAGLLLQQPSMSLAAEIRSGFESGVHSEVQRPRNEEERPLLVTEERSLFRFFDRAVTLTQPRTSREAEKERFFQESEPIS